MDRVLKQLLKLVCHVQGLWSCHAHSCPVFVSALNMVLAAKTCKYNCSCVHGLFICHNVNYFTGGDWLPALHLDDEASRDQ